MSIEQLQTRPENIPDICAQPAAQEIAEKWRQDQLFNLSGQATGLNRLPLDARQGLRRLVMRYNVANE